MTQTAATVEKALGLLEFFNDRRSSVGLSELARLSQHNKATTLRFLTALESKGFVEQDPATKLYHIGPAFLRLAALREASFPWSRAVMETLRWLVDETGETCHASSLTGDVLTNIGQVESPRSNRVIMDPSESLPFNATASGLVVLAHATPSLADRLLSHDLHSHTGQTETSPNRIRAEFPAIRAAGWCRSDGTFEDDVVGFAAPYFGTDSHAQGAVAVAMPAARATADAAEKTVTAVLAAARRLTRARGGHTDQPISPQKELDDA